MWEDEVRMKTNVWKVLGPAQAAAFCILIVACSEPPECERGPGLAEALARNSQDSAALSRTVTELAEATQNASTTEGQVLHERASGLATSLSEGEETSSLRVAGSIQSTRLAGQNLARKCGEWQSRLGL